MCWCEQEHRSTFSVIETAGRNDECSTGAHLQAMKGFQENCGDSPTCSEGSDNVHKLNMCKSFKGANAY